MVSCVACGLSQKHRKDGVTFHRFPNDSHRRQHWLKFVNREEDEITKYAVLCSQHFNEEEFDRSAIKVLLNNRAIPTKKAGLRFKYLRCRIEKAMSSNVQQQENEETTENVNKESHTLDPILIATVKEEITIDEGDTRVKEEQEEEKETEDVAELKELKEQVHNLTAALLNKDILIGNLRQRVWKQQKQLFRLQCVVKDLRKRKKIVVSSRCS